jgi:SAM-dependent methyltransferase
MQKDYFRAFALAFHNMKAPNIIIPLVLTYLPKTAKSVVDFGCGIGTWLKACKENGFDELVGLDGEWCNTDLLFKYINKEQFKYTDLEKPIELEKTYDLVISLEVAEHLSEESADVFVKSLVRAGNIILFSAAFPGQGGDHHLNEQYPSYWKEKFEQYGYIFYDIIRPSIWNNSTIDLWYRNNIFLVARNDIEIPFDHNNIAAIIDIIHPEYFSLQATRYVSPSRALTSLLHSFKMSVKNSA